MTSTRQQWKRNVVGLRKTAQEKAETTRRRAEEAIQVLLKEERLVTFKAVADMAHVSTAWLYGQEDLKQRIFDLRAEQASRPKVQTPPQERASDASKDALIAILRKRVQEQEEEIRRFKAEENAELRKLKQQIEIAYGRLSLYQQKYGPLGANAE